MNQINFRFNAESEMTTFLHTEDLVYHLDRDLYVPDNILFSNRYAIKTTDGSSTSLIAGSATQAGYVEGAGSHARFNYISSFLQLSPNQVLPRRYKKSLFKIPESHNKSNKPTCR